MMQHVFFARIVYNAYNLTTTDEQTAAEEWVACTMVRLSRELRPSSFVQLRDFRCVENCCTTHNR